MPIYLHIGTSKTGTSTVQRSFNENREALSRAGYLYPASPGHRNHTMLAIYAGAPERTRDLRIARGDDPDNREQFEELCKEFRESLIAECLSHDNIIFSNEHCYTRLDTDEAVERLKTLLYEISDDVRVICYLRRQDQHLLSGYSTAIVSGSTKPIDLSNPPRWPKLHSYYSALDRWARAFGADSIVAKPYKRNHLVDGDIVSDLLQQVGIDSGILLPVESVNESLDTETLEFLRLFNRHVPRIVDNKLNSFRNGVVRKLSELSRGPRMTLAPEVAEQYVNVYNSENRLVAERFLDTPSDSLFDTDFHAAETERELQVQRAVELGAALFNWRSGQLSNARIRLRQAESDIEVLRSQLEALRLELERSEARVGNSGEIANDAVIDVPRRSRSDRQ